MDYSRSEVKFGIYLVAVIILPFLFQGIQPISHYIDVMIFAGIFALVTLGLSLLMGYSGQISLAQAAFMGIGAYSTGVLTTLYSWPSMAALIAGMALTGAVAFIVGLPSLKLKGHYLAMATLGFGVIVHIVFNEEVELTGGPSGLVGIDTLKIATWRVDSPLEWYFLVWGLVTAVIVFSHNLAHSRIGRAFLAIHADEKAAGAMGISVSRYKVQVFVLSAVLASLAGSLYAHYVEFISPSSFDLLWSIRFVLMVMVGGMNNLWGALFGTVLLTFLSNEWLHVFAEWEMIIYGAILLTITLFVPEGIVPALSKLVRRRT
ncbi:branched-chain amino acid ABC transporter permease [Thermodesulforhabdus norvegica]|uniref:Amino acid/amide ABC transporter membrane protein 2, HAAT family n=1 Tax=Thermodesulforhabdus norvegica TaxID=39841 RepID=A0A1I4VRK5_9BACT|nr:branched-chain amino acid ABC transporter permease [Thermodesulforhabdus norvegica]SFN03803.1 amino acid/amide ABC transporter membrane protein 2, HAAT family [Thermodesulforhabdus norvegica]